MNKLNFNLQNTTSKIYHQSSFSNFKDFSPRINLMGIEKNTF